MEIQFYLIFSLHGLLYGIDTLQVQEIVDLPELTPVVTAPADILGVVNLRGSIVPVMDLDLRFGRQPDTYQLSDRVIFLEQQDKAIGIIVNQVHDVKPISTDCIDTQFASELDDRGSSLVAGIARLESDLITLLNPAHLFRSIALPLSVSTNGSAPDSAPPTHTERSSLLFANCSTEAQATLRDRARNLMRRSETEDSTESLESLPFAVLQISGEYFGIDLATVREFTNIHTITPIPCCPSHIVGNINLRGEIVTLLSLHSVLNVAQSGDRRAIVVAVDEITAGITVDEVLDVLYVHPATIKTLPAAVRTEGQEYAKGTASYRDRTMTLLDLPKLLTQTELVVNEYV